MRAIIDTSNPLPNLMLWTDETESTFTLVSPGESFELVMPDGTTKKCIWKPRECHVITGIGDPE